MIQKLYLTGYEKETFQEFLRKLKMRKITTVIDIRERPLSRKNGFSKVALKKLLEQNRMHYFHLPDLGSPKSLRDKLKKDSNYLEFFKRYRDYLVKKSQLLKKIFEIITNNGCSVLLCFEKDYQLCHRSIIASELLKWNKKLKITPI